MKKLYCLIFLLIMPSVYGMQKKNKSHKKFNIHNAQRKNGKKNKNFQKKQKQNEQMRKENKYIKQEQHQIYKQSFIQQNSAELQLLGTVFGLPLMLVAAHNVYFGTPMGCFECHDICRCLGM